MTPEQRVATIKQRQIDGGFTDFLIASKAEYQGYHKAIHGNSNASDVNLFKVEQALDRLEAQKRADALLEETLDVD